MEIEGEIKQFTDQYGLDQDLARAVVIHESGGNGSVVSIDGANGYFQVMPATFRSLRVDTNIEAGIKYLSQQVTRFGREDYALAAYNGGSGSSHTAPADVSGNTPVCGAGQRLSQRAEALRCIGATPRARRPARTGA